MLSVTAFVEISNLRSVKVWIHYCPFCDNAKKLVLHYINRYVVQFLCQFSCLHCHNWKLSVFLIRTHTLTHSHTAVCAVTPTCLRRFDGHLVGVRPDSMLAPGSQLEGVGGERLQVLQQVGGGRLKAHFLLRGTGQWETSVCEGKEKGWLRGVDPSFHFNIDVNSSFLCSTIHPVPHLFFNLLSSIWPYIHLESQQNEAPPSFILTSSVSSARR